MYGAPGLQAPAGALEAQLAALQERNRELAEAAQSWQADVTAAVKREFEAIATDLTRVKNLAIAGSGSGQPVSPECGAFARAADRLLKIVDYSSAPLWREECWTAGPAAVLARAGAETAYDKQW